MAWNCCCPAYNFNKNHNVSIDPAASGVSLNDEIPLSDRDHSDLVNDGLQSYEINNQRANIMKIDSLDYDSDAYNREHYNKSKSRV